MSAENWFYVLLQVCGHWRHRTKTRWVLMIRILWLFKLLFHWKHYFSHFLLPYKLANNFVLNYRKQLKIRNVIPNRSSKRFYLKQLCLPLTVNYEKVMSFKELSGSALTSRYGLLVCLALFVSKELAMLLRNSRDFIMHEIFLRLQFQNYRILFAMPM